MAWWTPLSTPGRVLTSGLVQWLSNPTEKSYWAVVSPCIRGRVATEAGDGQEQVELSEVSAAIEDTGSELALEKLALIDPQTAEFVKIRDFVGLPIEETAGVVDF